MALQKEYWIEDIEKNLYASNRFLGLIGKDDSKYVNNKTVHIPESGSKPGVEMDRSVVPATLSQRTDGEGTYSMNSYSTDPILLKDYDDEWFLSYPKRNDVMGDHINTLSDAIAKQTLYKWGATGVTTVSGSNIVRTTGSASSGSWAHNNVTGTRKLLTLADFRNGMKVLGSQDLGAGQIYMIIPESMYWNDLMSITEFTKTLDFGGKAVLPDGMITSALGVTIVRRSSVIVYDNTATPVRKTLNANGTIASEGAADNNGILLVHEKYVRKALGSIKIFTKEDDPTLYGSAISAEVIHGAAKARTTELGVVSIVQAA